MSCLLHCLFSRGENDALMQTLKSFEEQLTMNKIKIATENKLRYLHQNL